MHNQDSLQGELYEVHEEHVVWASEALGHVTVQKEQVKSLFSSVPLKMHGVKEACYWMELINMDVVYQCGKREPDRVAFLSMKDVFLYSGYVNQGHQYQGKIVGAGSQSRGNRVRQDWLVDLDVVLRHYEYRHLAGLKYEAEAESENTLLEEYEATYSLHWFFSTRTFWFAESTVLQDETRNIDERYALGSGIGYQFWDTGRTAFSVETGGEYVYEQLGIELAPVNEFFSWRLASSYRYLFPRNIAFYINADILQSVNTSEQWEMDAEAGVSMPIALGITADLKYEFEYDNTPSEGLEKRDSMLRFGFGYEW